MQHYLTQITNLPSQYYTAGLWFLGAGLAASLTVQIVKHFNKIESAKISRLLITGASFIISAANYIVSTPSQSLSILASHTAMVLGAAHVVYWVSISPAYSWFMKLVSDADSFRQTTAPQPASVAEPPAATFAD